MHFLFKIFFIGLLLNVVKAEEEQEQVGIVEYIQELTGRLDKLTKTIEELEARLQILEEHSHAKAVEAKTEGGKDLSHNKLISQEKVKMSSPPAGGPDRLWDEAMCALQKKNIEVAEKKFLDFIYFYAEYSHAKEAHYWLGEIKLLSKQYMQAQKHYAPAYKSFPEDNPRKGEIGLKIAECYFALEKNKEGCLFLKEILKLQQKGAAISTATLQLLEQYWAKYKCPSL